MQKLFFITTFFRALNSAANRLAARIDPGLLQVPRVGRYGFVLARIGMRCIAFPVEVMMIVPVMPVSVRPA